ncbi:MAG: PQQ-dependent sugar dehydrogenase [Candidatus Nitrosocosmicus sp.]|nr:PQQ-dependent sugar dehydrogenase [Candidatus Nitrosocosmicus sp.]MDN5866833.1 PQQ-dependent sugar dehydrogenase [Candidatus Nitrosocosmicus sp.]
MKRFVIFVITLIVITFAVVKYFDYSLFIESYINPLQNQKQIEINSKYKDSIDVDLYVEGLSFPTSMTFVDKNTILVSEKDQGNVRLISNGILQKDPIYTIKNISNEKEQGLLGITSASKYESKKETQADYLDFSSSSHPISTMDAPTSLREPIIHDSNHVIYLYFTEKIYKSRDNYSIDVQQKELNHTIRNKVYEYTWDGIGPFSNPRLIMDMPAEPGPYHNGGKIRMDKSGNLYAVIGDLTATNNTLQNYPQGKNQSISIPNNSSVIIRVNPSIESLIPSHNPLYSYNSNNTKLNFAKYYYAYGIRNSFGMDIDPLTGKLWNTENGEDSYDEINLVQPGFNSGWSKIMGPIQRNNNTSVSDLVVLNGSHYSDPEFSWRVPIGVTDIEFLDSSLLGDDLENNIFIGDINNGNLYFLKIDSNRSGININNSVLERGNEKGLQDLVVDNKDELEKVIFAKGFDGRITDIETGLDGNLYILTYFDGKIYRITRAEK